MPKQKTYSNVNDLLNHIFNKHVKDVDWMKINNPVNINNEMEFFNDTPTNQNHQKLKHIHMFSAFFLGSWMHGHNVVLKCMMKVDINNVTEKYHDHLLFLNNWLNHDDDNSLNFYKYRKNLADLLARIKMFNGEE